MATALVAATPLDAGPLFTDPLMRDLERRVVLHVEPAWTPQHVRAARLRLESAGGHTAEHVVTAVRGDASLPWTQSELTAKFARYCAGSLREDRAGRTGQSHPARAAAGRRLSGGWVSGRSQRWMISAS